MVKRVLLDTSVLISALDDKGKTKPEEREKAKQKLRELLNDENVALAITPLVRYEVLRGADWGDTERYQKLRDALNTFEEFEISCEIAELVTNLYRFDRHQAKEKQRDKNLEKRKFDVFHYATAKCLQMHQGFRIINFLHVNRLFLLGLHHSKSMGQAEVIKNVRPT